MIFKCKMCGGDIVPIEGTNTGKCEYCKSVMTLPDLDNEKIVNLYNRANDFRLSNDFDKAYGIYETILELDNKQIEAHWGLLLCKYGVEYVDDPKTGKKIPTCHRTIPSSILKDKEFEIIKKGSYGDALKLYEDEATTIAEIQKKILEISSKEDPYDIFICYKESDDKGERTHDSVIAQDIYDKLTEKGYKVFFARITLEDKLGVEYEPFIYSALTSSKVMLVVGTKEEYFNATWVKNEWARFIEMMKHDKSKTLIPVYSKMDAYKIPEEFAMYQAQSMDKVGAIQDLIRGIDKIIDTSRNKSDDFTLEMYEKFKQMKAEEEEELRQSQALQQVDTVNKATSKVFKIVTFIISFLQAVVIISMATKNNVPYVTDTYETIGVGFTPNYKQISMIIIIMCLITLVSYFIAFISKKTNIFSKYLYALNILLGSSIFILNIKYHYIIMWPFITFVVLNIVLLLIKPKWTLVNKVIYVPKEKKKEIMEENKQIRLNFDPKEKYPKHIYIIMIVTVLIFVTSVILNNTLSRVSTSNPRNKNEAQLIVTCEYINFRAKAEFYSNKLGKVHGNDIYTILGKNEKYDYDDSLNGVWYHIKNAQGVEGYIYSSEKEPCVRILDDNE